MTKQILFSKVQRAKRRRAFPFCLFVLFLSLLYATHAAATIDLTLFGPKRYDRLKGKPTEYTGAFQRCNPATEAILKITNGGGESTRIKAASIQVNGGEVVSENEFKQRVPAIEKVIPISQTNELRVVLKSGMPDELDSGNDKDQSFLIIEILGKGCDDIPPAISNSEPADGSLLNTPMPRIAAQYADNTGGAGIDTSTVRITVDGTDVTSSANISETGVSYTPTSNLPEGAHSVAVSVSDLAHNPASQAWSFTTDTVSPAITITSPQSNQILTTSQIVVSGTISEPTAALTINNVAVEVSGQTFTRELGLSEGLNTITIEATDRAGNSSTIIRTVTLDTASPVLVVTDPAQDMFTNLSGLALTGTVADLTGATVVVNFDGTLYTPAVLDGAFQQQLTFVVQKSYTVIVTATDAAGNQATVQRNILYDATPPTVMIDPVTTPTNRQSQTISGTMEADATVNITSSTATPGQAMYPTTSTWRVELTNMTEGDNAISVTATDQAGNVSNPMSAAILLDTTLPVTTATPAGGVNGPGLQVSLTSSETATIYYTTDGATPTTSSAVYTGPVSIPASTMLAYFAVDLAGNLEDVKTAAYTVDAAPPTGSLAINNGAGFTNSLTVTLALGCADDLSGCASLQLSNDNQSWTTPEPYTVEKTWITSPGDGEKTVYVKYEDGVGNWSVASAAIILDTTVPSVSITFPTAGATTNSTPLLLYAVSDGTVVVQVDGVVVEKVSGNMLDQLANGQHTVLVQSTDSAGNVSSASVTFTVDLNYATTVCGSITTNTTWSLAKSPYKVTCDVYVYGSEAPTLTIEPGVVVKFNQYATLYIGYSWMQGALSAVGTAAAPITFTSSQTTPTTGYWGGIFFFDGTVDTSTKLSYVTIEYGGYGNNSNLTMSSASPTVMNSTIRKSSGYGIYMVNSGPAIQNNVITDNATSGIYNAGGSSFTAMGNTITNNGTYGVYDSMGSAVLSGNTISGNGSYPARMGINQVGHVNTYGTNGINAVEVIGGTVSQNLTMRNLGVPYIVMGDVYVYGSGAPTLFIEPGVVIKFNKYATLYIGYSWMQGALSAVGTAAAPITFTSSQTTPTTGYWGGIFFFDGTVDANTKLSYVTIEYGGYGNNSNLTMNSASPTVMNSTIRKSSGYGIYLVNAGPVIQDNVITDNATSGIYNAGGSSFTATGNTITNNGAYGINDSTGSAAVVSENTISANGSYPARLGINQVGNVNTYGTNGINAVEVIGGTVSQNLTMRNLGVPYIVMGDVYVYGSGAPTLFIEPGVVIKFNKYATLYIGYSWMQGALSAVGTAAAPITFTSSQTTPTTGYWGGIFFFDGTVDASTKLSYVTIEYGGYGNNSNLTMNSASPTVMNSTIRKSSGYGIYLVNAGPAIQDNVITDNATSGIYNAGGSSFTATGNTITNNGAYGINDSTGSAAVVSGNIISANGSYPARLGINQVGHVNTYGTNGINAIEVIGNTIGQNLTMKNNGPSYIITSDITVGSSSNPIFTIEEGVTVKFNNGTGLTIANGSGSPGALKAVGTATSPIVFTSNDLNPAPGKWKGITFNSGTIGANTMLDYVTVEYGGQGGAYYNANLVINSSSPVIMNSTIRNSAGSGVYLTSASNSPVIVNSDITGNKWGVYSSSSNPYVLYSNIHANTTAGVWNATTSPDVDARENWWGVATGPTYTAGNPGGRGDSITDHVLYNPWLGQATGSNLSITETRAMPTSLNPNGGYITFTAHLSSSATWTITISDGNSNTVSTFTGTGTTIKQKWHGVDSQSIKVADGLYYYRIDAQDPASGASASSPEGLFMVSSQVPIVYMNPPVDNQMFTGGATINITGTASDPVDFKNYILEYGAGGNPTSWTNVKTSTAPATDTLLYAWNTSSLAGGLYTLRLTATDNAGNVVISTARVRLLWIQNNAASQTFISPNGDGIQDNTTISASFTHKSAWTLTFKDSGGAPVRTFSGTAQSLAQEWNGMNDAGAVVPDRIYTYTISAVSPETGVTATEATGMVVVDATSPIAGIEAPAATSLLWNTVTVTGTATDANFAEYRLEYGPADGAGPWTLITAATTSISGGTLGTWITNDATNTVLAQNGDYALRLTATDRAGNSARSTVPVSLDNLHLSNIVPSSHTLDTLAGQTSTVSFTLNSAATVTFKIVSELTGSPFYHAPPLSAPAAGSYSFTWDGKKNDGATVPDEAYLYILEAANGLRTDSYRPVAPVGAGTISCTPPPYSFYPEMNVPMTLTYTPSLASRVSISIAWGTQTPFTIQDRFPVLPIEQTFVWDGWSPGNKLLDMGAMPTCSMTSLLPENFIITMGDTVRITDLKTDPHLVNISYGEFSLIKYKLSSDAIVSVWLTSPSGTIIPLISNSFQTFGPYDGQQVLEWRGLDASDPNGATTLIKEEGNHMITVQAANPATGTLSTMRGNQRIQY